MKNAFENLKGIKDKFKTAYNLYDAIIRLSNNKQLNKGNTINKLMAI